MIADGGPIMAAECHCTSCGIAAERMEALPGALPIRVDTGGTQFVLLRKDRVSFQEGHDLLRSLWLTPQSKTRRVVAVCCNTPMFLDFCHGHWLSIYADRWPAVSRPRMTLRTMTGDRTDPAPLPNDIPNPKSHGMGFMVRLLGAWVAMGFRTPEVAVGQQRLESDV